MFYRTKKNYYNSLVIQEGLFRFYEKSFAPINIFKKQLDIWLTLICFFLLGFGLLYTMFIPFGYGIIWILLPFTQLYLFYTPLSLLYWILSISFITCLYSFKLCFFFIKEMRLLLFIEYGLTQTLFEKFCNTASKKKNFFFMFLITICCFLPQIGLFIIWIFPFLFEYYCVSELFHTYFTYLEKKKIQPSEFSTLISLNYDFFMGGTTEIIAENESIDLSEKPNISNNYEYWPFSFRQQKYFIQGGANINTFQFPSSKFYVEDDFWLEDELVYGATLKDFEAPRFSETGTVLSFQNSFSDEVNYNKETAKNEMERSKMDNELLSDRSLESFFPDAVSVSEYAQFLLNLPEKYYLYFKELKTPIVPLYNMSSLFSPQSLQFAYKKDLFFYNDINFENITINLHTLKLFSDTLYTKDFIEKKHWYLVNSTNFTQTRGRVFGPFYDLLTPEAGADTSGYKTPNWFFIQFCYQTLFIWCFLNIFLFFFLFFFGIPADWLQTGRSTYSYNLLVFFDLLENTRYLQSDWGYTKLPYGDVIIRDYFTYMQPAYFKKVPFYEALWLKGKELKQYQATKTVEDIVRDEIAPAEKRPIDPVFPVSNYVDNFSVLYDDMEQRWQLRAPLNKKKKFNKFIENYLKEITQLQCAETSYLPIVFNDYFYLSFLRAPYPTEFLDWYMLYLPEEQLARFAYLIRSMPVEKVNLNVFYHEEMFNPEVSLLDYNGAIDYSAMGENYDEDEEDEEDISDILDETDDVINTETQNNSEVLGSNSDNLNEMFDVTNTLENRSNDTSGVEIRGTVGFDEKTNGTKFMGESLQTPSGEAIPFLKQKHSFLTIRDYWRSGHFTVWSFIPFVFKNFTLFEIFSAFTQGYIKSKNRKHSPTIFYYVKRQKRNVRVLQNLSDFYFNKDFYIKKEKKVDDFMKIFLNWQNKQNKTKD